MPPARLRLVVALVAGVLGSASVSGRARDAVSCSAPARRRARSSPRCRGRALAIARRRDRAVRRGVDAAGARRAWCTHRSRRSWNARAAVDDRGTLLDDPGRARGTRAEVLLRVDARDRRAGATSAGDRTVLVTAGGESRAAGCGCSRPATEVTVAGWLAAARRTSTSDLRWRHAVGRLRRHRAGRVRPPRSPLRRAANALRALVLRGRRPPAADRARPDGRLPARRHPRAAPRRRGAASGRRAHAPARRVGSQRRVRVGAGRPAAAPAAGSAASWSPASSSSCCSGR